MGANTLSCKNSQSTQRFTQMRQKKRSRPNPRKDKVTFDVKKFNNDGFFQLGGAYLPSEVIGCIMQFVPAYPYLLVLRRVSKQWCNELVTNPRVTHLDAVNRQVVFDQWNNVLHYNISKDGQKYKPLQDLKTMIEYFPNITSVAIGLDSIGYKHWWKELKRVKNLERLQVIGLPYAKSPPSLHIPYNLNVKTLSLSNLAILGQGVASVVAAIQDNLPESVSLEYCAYIDEEMEQLAKLLRDRLIITDKNHSMNVIGYINRAKRDGFPVGYVMIGSNANIIDAALSPLNVIHFEYLMDELIKAAESGEETTIPVPTPTQINYIRDTTMAINTVKRIIKHSLPFDLNEKFGISGVVATLLGHAIIARDTALIDFYTSIGAPAYVEGCVNPLHRLVQLPYADADHQFVETILDLHPELLTIGDQDGMIDNGKHDLRLQFSLQHNHLNILKTFVKYGLSLDVEINGKHLIEHYVQRGLPTLVAYILDSIQLSDELLLKCVEAIPFDPPNLPPKLMIKVFHTKYGTDWIQKLELGPRKENLFLHSVQRSSINEPYLQFLIETCKFDPNSRNADGLSALALLPLRKVPESVFKLLLDSGCKLDTFNNGPFMERVLSNLYDQRSIFNVYDTFRVLDVEPLSLRDSTGQTLLHYYQTRGLFDIDDIDALNSVCDNNGILPFLLLCARNANNEKFIKKNGRSLRDLAHHSAGVANAIGVVQYLARLELYDTHICKFLLGLGMPNLEQRDTGVPGSPTILHQLLVQDIGTARIIVFMRTVRDKSDDFEAYINMKTIVDTENKQERTALEMAIETGRFAVVKMLLQNNAQLYGKVLAVDAFEHEQYHLALKLAASEWSNSNILSAKQIQVAIHNDMSMDQEEIISIIGTLSKQQKEEFLKHMCQVGAGSTEPSDFTVNCSTVQMLCHYRKSNILQYLFTLLPKQQQKLEDMLDLVIAPEPIFNNNILHFLCNRYALICLMATNKETTSGQQKPLPKLMISMLMSYEYVRSKHLFSQKNKKGFTPAEMLPSQNKGIVTEYAPNK